MLFSDLFGEQVFGNKDVSDEEMETNASEESEGVCTWMAAVKFMSHYNYRPVWHLDNWFYW